MYIELDFLHCEKWMLQMESWWPRGIYDQKKKKRL